MKEPSRRLRAFLTRQMAAALATHAPAPPFRSLAFLHLFSTYIYQHSSRTPPVTRQKKAHHGLSNEIVNRTLTFYDRLLSLTWSPTWLLASTASYYDRLQHSWPPRHSPPPIRLIAPVNGLRPVLMSSTATFNFSGLHTCLSGLVLSASGSDLFSPS